MSSSGFPSACAAPPVQFHVADPVASSEIIAVTNVSGTTWTVTRGAESTTPVTHSAGFTVYQVTTAGGLTSLSYYRTDWLNVVTQYGADPTGANDSTAAINGAIAAVESTGGTVLVPPGLYKTSGALNTASGVVIQGAGQDAAIIQQTSTTAPGITSTGARYCSIRDLMLQGPGSGSGTGLYFNYSRAGCRQHRPAEPARLPVRRRRCQPADPDRLHGHQRPVRGQRRQRLHPGQRHQHQARCLLRHREHRQRLRVRHHDVLRRSGLRRGF